MLINIKASHILVSVDHTEEVRFQKIVMKGLRNIGCKDEVEVTLFYIIIQAESGHWNADSLYMYTSL